VLFALRQTFVRRRHRPTIFTSCCSARDDFDKTFGVGFAASRACCRRLWRPPHSTACAPKSLQWLPFLSDTVLVPVSPV
jgi:hypothetical protein